MTTNPNLKVGTPMKIFNEVEKCVWEPDYANRFPQSLPIHGVKGRLQIDIGNVKWSAELSVQV